MNKSLDRRFHPRKEFGQQAITLEMLSHGWIKRENLRLSVQGHNISSGGVQIVVSKPLRKGDVVKIEIPFIGDEVKMPIYAEVVWCNLLNDSVHVGLQFLN